MVAARQQKLVGFRDGRTNTMIRDREAQRSLSSRKETSSSFTVSRSTLLQCCCFRESCFFCSNYGHFLPERVSFAGFAIYP